MKNKIRLVLSAVLVALSLVYLNISYVIYDHLTQVTPGGGVSAVNTPASFKVLGLPRFADFDTTPYLMPDYETVRFPSRESGLMLAGWYIPGDPTAPVVILTHGLNSCKCHHEVLLSAGMLHRNGFNVLVYDLHNHGESESDGGRYAGGNTEYLDLLGAWDWLIAEKGFAPERIGAVGYSLGAGTTLIAFSQEPRLAAVWVDSPYADLQVAINEEMARNNYPTWLVPGGLLMARVLDGVDLLAHNPSEAIRQDAGRPLFIVHGTGDTRINVHHSYDLAALAAQTGANVTTWFPEGVEHARANLELPAEYEQRLVDFFGGALGK